MEIRHDHGAPAKAWKLDMFYNSEPGNKRRGINREISECQLKLDGPDETPKITYKIEMRKEEGFIKPSFVAKKFAVLTFKTPRSGSVVAQLKEVD